MEKINEILKKRRALDDAITLIHWDLETEAPKLAVERMSKTLGYLTGESYSTVINDDFKNLVYNIDVNKLNDLDKKIIEEIKKEFFEKMEKIPKKEYQEYSELKVLSAKKWEEAKQKNDFNIFKDYLSKIIEMNKQFIKYIGYEGHPYNALLDEFEPQFLVDEVDNFFNKIKSDLLPVIKNIVENKKEENKKIKQIFEAMEFDIEKQKILSNEVLRIIKFNFDKGILKESEHPFTTNIGNKNVRITTHYHKNNLLSAIYSTIHEGGHALYEQNIIDEISETILGTGTSMGIHESQSRIYENMFGRSKQFLKFIYPKINELFELEKNGINIDEFYNYVNNVENSLIRIEADELTYPIHILIRYELEKEIFENLDKKTDVDELAKKWEEKYEQYLGIKPTTFSEGILQDVHWSDGLFGYFPSYALGSAYSAQIYNAMNKEINIDEELGKGNFEKINEFLKEKIHKYGRTKTPKELLKIATGEDFNPQYYVDYLIKKFTKI